MAVTSAQLATYSNREDDDFAAQCLKEAEALVTQHIGKVSIPTEVKDRAVLEVGSNLLRRGAHLDGLAGYDSTDITPLRITRDPLQAARAILAPYLYTGVY